MQCFLKFSFFSSIEFPPFCTEAQHFDRVVHSFIKAKAVQWTVNSKS